MLEIVLAFQAASAAIEGIRSCCDALNEGRAEIQRIKKTVEGGVNDAVSYTHLTLPTNREV